MEFGQIKEAIDEIRHEIFIHSLNRKPMEELLSLSERVDSLKGEFLDATFIQAEVKFLEDIRFRLLECQLILQIQIGGLKGKDVAKEIEQLETLYKPTIAN